MAMSLLVIVAVAGLAWLWGSRGFFSALLHLACVIAAGAIAFAAWEPLAYFLLARSGSQLVADIAWGVALALPFAGSLAVLRLVTDSLVPANADLDTASNFIGGGACGLAAGVITTGIMVISMGYIRGSTALWGYTPVTYEKSGSIVRTGRLLLPVDDLTVRLYSRLSATTLRTGTPLATWHPDLQLEHALLRTNFNNGSSRHVLRPEDVKLLGRYTVGRGANLPVNELVTDGFDGRVQSVTNLDGSKPGTGAYIEGYALSLLATAREATGEILAGAGQFALVATRDDGRGSTTILPFAMISQAKGDNVALGRWRFDGEKVFISSVGGRSDMPVALEFLVPSGFTPLALYAKGARIDLRTPAGTPIEPFAQFEDTGRRDIAIETLDIVRAATTTPLDASGAGTVAVNPENNSFEGTVRVTNAMRYVLAKGSTSGLTVDDKNRISDGEARFRNAELANFSKNIDRSLRVEKFAVTNDTVVVMVDAAGESPMSLVSEAASAPGVTGAPALVDTQGQTYQAIGYIYRDTLETHFRFTPGRPIRSTADLPSLSRSRPDQQLTLIFRPSRGVSIDAFAIGGTVLQKIEPPLLLNQNQASR